MYVLQWRDWCRCVGMTTKSVDQHSLQSSLTWSGMWTEECKINNKKTVSHKLPIHITHISNSHNIYNARCLHSVIELYKKTAAYMFRIVYDHVACIVIFIAQHVTKRCVYLLILFTKCSRSVNIVDVILQRLETYASNLEELVDQRTQQLMQEKQKSDKLLYRMLPR